MNTTEFWQKVYIAAIRGLSSMNLDRDENEIAQEIANEAVIHYKAATEPGGVL
jgi:hypothetical protein